MSANPSQCEWLPLSLGSFFFFSCCSTAKSREYTLTRKKWKLFIYPNSINIIPDIRWYDEAAWMRFYSHSNISHIKANAQALPQINIFFYCLSPSLFDDYHDSYAKLTISLFPLFLCHCYWFRQQHMFINIECNNYYDYCYRVDGIKSTLFLWWWWRWLATFQSLIK